MWCCICKSEEHKAIDCPLSWYRCPASHRDAAPDESEAGANSSNSPDAACSHAGDTEANGDCDPPPATSEHHLIDSQGLLNSEPPLTNLPVRAATVMPSSHDTSLLTDLNMLESEEIGDDDESSGEEASDDDPVMDEDAGDIEHVDADDGRCAGSQVASSQGLDSISAQEAIP